MTKLENIVEDMLEYCKEQSVLCMDCPYYAVCVAIDYDNEVDNKESIIKKLNEPMEN